MIQPLIRRVRRWYHRVMPEGYLTISQVADRLDLDPSRIKRLIKDGKLKAERFGKRMWIIKETDLAEFEATRNTKPGRPRKSDIGA